MVRLLRRDHGCIAGEHEVNARVGHQVRLELGDVHVQSTVEAQRRSQRGDDLRQQPVQVGVSRALDVKVAAAYVVQRLVVVHDGHVCVFQERVHAKHRVVRLNHCGSDLRARPHGERDLRLLPVVHRQALQHQATEPGASASADGIVDHEALEASAVVGQLPDPIQDEVDDLLADGVVPSREVVRGVLLAGDELLRVKQLTVGTRAYFIDHSGLQVDHHAAGDVLAGASLGEERVEGIVAASDRLIRGHLAVRLDTVLKAEKLPACIANLHTRLPNVDADRLTHCVE
mmetsp:Transcript_87052/g.230521  ORF Transcript_87052/g.230521 Transcript_87052/m.230521 type:complete len:287 (+) Transcript_87052:756-1616(+)